MGIHISWDTKTNFRFLLYFYTASMILPSSSILYMIYDSLQLKIITLLIALWELYEKIILFFFFLGLFGSFCFHCDTWVHTLLVVTLLS